MATMDNIHDAQDQVANLQGQLDNVQQMLDKAEAVAAAGEAAKERAQQLLVISAILVAVGLLLLIRGGRKKQSGWHPTPRRCATPSRFRRPPTEPEPDAVCEAVRPAPTPTSGSPQTQERLWDVPPVEVTAGNAA